MIRLNHTDTRGGINPTLIEDFLIPGNLQGKWFCLCHKSSVTTKTLNKAVSKGTIKYHPYTNEMYEKYIF